MKIDPIKIMIANQHLQNVTEKVASTPNYPRDKFYRTIQNRVSEYQQLGCLEIVSEKLSDIANMFIQCGNADFAGIICSMLVKLEQLPFEMREKYILQAIDVAKRQNDTIHLVSRLEDLHREYVNIGDKNKTLKILIKEENTLKEIVGDFETAQKNFKTLFYKNENVENFENLLATIQVDIAKIIISKKPKKAIQKLKSAMRIFEKLGDMEQYDFAEKMLARAERNREVSKISKRNRC